MDRIAGHYDKIILTLIMCLVILFMATFSPFAESTNAVAVIAPALIAIIVAGLAAVGITFVTTGAFDNVNDYVTSLLEDFALDNNTTVDALFKGTQSGTDKIGRILINNRFVILIQTFATYLISRFSLSDNGNYTVVTTGASIGSIPLYDLPFGVYDTRGAGVRYEQYVGNAYVLLQYTNTSQNGINICALSPTANTEIKRYTIRSDGTFIETPVTLSFVANSFWYTDGGRGYAASGYDFSPYSVYPYGTLDNLINSNYPIVTGADYGIDIVTGVITPPYSDTDYTNGDGAIIDVDADWGLTYTDVTEDVIPEEFSDSKEGTATIEYVAEDEVAEAVEDTSEITNLPAGTIPFTPLQLPQFHLVDIWHYVAQWIEDTAVAAGALMAIVVQEPHPMVNLFYATVCLAIIFGIIKGLAK